MQAERPALVVVSHGLVARADDGWLIKNRIAHIVGGLEARGWRVRLVSRAAGMQPFLTERLGEEIEVIPFDLEASIGQRMRDAVRVVSAVRSATHVLAFMPSLFSATLTSIAGRRTVIYAGSSWALQGKSTARVRLEQFAAGRAREAIVAGDAVLERYREISPHASRCVPLVAEEVCERLRGDPQCAPCQDPVRVLYVGSVRRDKGVEELLDALTQVEGMTCRIVGSIAGNEAEFGRRVCDRIGSMRHIAILDYLDWDALKEQYEWADVLVLPSYSEGFPRVVYEATAFGASLVLTPVGGLLSQLSDSAHAMYVPVGSANAIREALIQVRDDPDLKPRLVAGAWRALGSLITDPDPIAQFERALAA